MLLQSSRGNTGTLMLRLLLIVAPAAAIDRATSSNADCGTSGVLIGSYGNFYETTGTLALPGCTINSGDIPIYQQMDVGYLTTTQYNRFLHMCIVQSGTPPPKPKPVATVLLTVADPGSHFADPNYGRWMHSLYTEADVPSTVAASICPGSSDGECDDGGSGSEWSTCALGRDFTDCGARPSNTPDYNPIWFGCTGTLISNIPRFASCPTSSAACPGASTSSSSSPSPSPPPPSPSPPPPTSFTSSSPPPSPPPPSSLGGGGGATCCATVTVTNSPTCDGVYTLDASPQLASYRGQPVDMTYSGTNYKMLHHSATTGLWACYDGGSSVGDTACTKACSQLPAACPSQETWGNAALGFGSIALACVPICVPITPTTLDPSCPDVITASTCPDPSSCTDCCQSSSLALNSDRTAYFNDYIYLYIDPSTNLWTSSESLCTESRSTFTSSSAMLCPTGISSTSWSSGAVRAGSTLDITAPYVVSTSFTLGGSIADYDTSAVRYSIQSTLANAAGVSVYDVILTLAAGSVVVTAVIGVSTQAAATTMSNTLETGILATPAALESALIAQFQNDGQITTPTVQTLTPPAVAAPPADPATSFPIIIAIGATAGVAVLLVVAVAVTCMLKKKSPTKAGTATSGSSTSDSSV